LLSLAEKLARLKIVRSGSVGPVTFWDLISRYGSGEKALHALPVLTKSSGRAFKICSDDEIEREQEALESIGAELIFLEDELYPPLLRAIPDPPPLLTFLGQRETLLSFRRRNFISVVGSRNASLHGNKFCSFLCKGLGSRGVVIVSGLARGIDTCAHVSGLKTGTIAILAGGINVIYPQENERLYKEIAESGCIFTEMPFNTATQPQLFPRRNRIIAGISYGTVVIEAAEQSGSLITARMAAEYGKEIFAVPGSPLDPRSIGCNLLLKDGATLVNGPQDVLDSLENQKIIRESSLHEERAEFSAKISDLDLEKIRKQILESLSATPITIEELILSLKISPQEVLAALIELELSNKISRLHGQRVCLALGAKC
jgi:DNA processing protein